MSEVPEFISTGQVADELGLAVSTVDKYTTLGILTPIGHVGGRRVWQRDHLPLFRAAVDARRARNLSGGTLDDDEQQP